MAAPEGGQRNLDDLYPRIVEAMSLEGIQIHLNSEYGVFISEDDRLSVFDLNDERRVDDVRQLVDLLQKMDRKAFEELCSLLTEYGHSDLAQELTRRRLSYESGRMQKSSKPADAEAVVPLCVEDLVDYVGQIAQERPDERLIQALSDSDAVASRYWRIARLLGLSIDAMEHIEECVAQDQLKKMVVLKVFRKWQEIQGGSTLCLFQVLHYLKIDLQPFVGHVNAIHRTGTDSATSMNDQFSELPITTAILTATQSEYDTVLGYFGEEQNDPPMNYGVYLCNNDPSLEGNPPKVYTFDVNGSNLKHVEGLLLVTFPAVRKAFVVYQPKSSKARQATSEMLHLADNYNWPLKYFYIIGFCSYYAKEPQVALGQIMLVDCLDDYNQGDLTDGQFTFVSNQHKMSPELFQTVFHWANNGPKPEWNVPFEQAKRVCSAPRRVRSAEVASKLLANDNCIAMETDGVGMLTVKEVVNVLQKDEARSHLEYIVVKGAAHHADVPSEQPQPVQLFNQNPRECGALEREAIATLHSIVLVTRCIVLDMPRITGV